MTTQRPPFPEVIDSTTISTFRSCPHKYYWEYLHHFKPKMPSIHLHAGGAFAKGLEVCRRAFYEQGVPGRDAVALGLAALMRDYGDFDAGDHAKSLERMAGAFEFYFDRYPLETDQALPYHLPDGKRAIEFSFAEPLDILHPETGDPLVYSGRCDMIAEFANGIYIFDDKTASSLGASWSKQWEQRSQFTGYCAMAAKAGIPVNGVLVRGISILKTKYDTQQAISSRAPWEMVRWEDQLNRDLRRMIQSWEEGHWDYNLDHACSEYGGCSFLQACKSPDPAPWLEMYFERRVWDPLTHTERLVQP